MEKPGIKTTEFWVTLGSALIMVLTAAGIFTSDAAQAVTESWTGIVGAVGTVIVSGTYIFSRATIKKAASNNTKPE